MKMRNIMVILIFCQFCENKNESDKVGDHCHLTGKYRCPAHRKCKIDITQKRSNFVAFMFHNFSD